MKNLVTDIAGVRVGHAGDAKLASGTTAIIFDSPAVAAIDMIWKSAGLAFSHDGGFGSVLGKSALAEAIAA